MGNRRTYVVPFPQSSPRSLLLAAALTVAGCGMLGPTDSGDDSVARTTAALDYPVPNGATNSNVISNYLFCANENERCVVGGAKYAAFGGGTSFVFKPITGTFTCSPAAFDGRSPNTGGAARACFFANYSFIRSESNTVVNGIVNEVAFGVDGLFSFRRVSGAWTCDLRTFSEPSSLTVGKTKACYQAVSPYSKVNVGATMSGLNNTPLFWGANGVFVAAFLSGTQTCRVETFGSPPLPGDCYRFPYSWVADEWGDHTTFTLTSSGTLYYGTYTGNFLTKALTAGTYTCSNQLAGDDPAVGYAKHCYLAAL